MPKYLRTKITALPVDVHDLVSRFFLALPSLAETTDLFLTRRIDKDVERIRTSAQKKGRAAANDHRVALDAAPEMTRCMNSTMLSASK